MQWNTRRTFGMLILAACVGLGAAPARAEKTLLRLRFDGPVLEAPNDAAGLLAIFEKTQMKSLREYTDMIRRAATDKKIAGLVLILESPQLKLAQVEELHRALRAFRDKGKPVYCYMDEAGNAAYALASAASHITLAENSELAIVGLHAEAMFFKGLMDKIGVEAEMLHCGAYKSALEPFTRTEPSPEAAENLNWLLDGIYERWIQMIADGRKLTTDEVRQIVDRAPLNAPDALKAKLVDEVSGFEDFRKNLHKEFGKDVVVLKEYQQAEEGVELDTSNPFTLIPQIIEMLEGATKETAEPAVGLVYLEGPIMTGESEESPFADTSVGSTTVRMALDTVREDENIKAVVLRVDSPGGSALASDIIWRAASRLAAEKPLIVSMGQVAGSGGYYVAIPGDTVFAEASTITGSIGVVGGKMVLRGLMHDKLGITTTEFSRGKRAGLMSTNRKWTSDERAWIEKYMNEVYEQFKGRVMKSRGSKLKKEIGQLAEGRVFTGAQALELGLVDKLGGLQDALDLAASKAGLGKEYDVQLVPKPSGIAALFNLLKKMSGEDENDPYRIALGRYGADPLARAALPLLHQVAPGQVRELLNGLRTLLMLQDEHVGCFMAVPAVR